MYYLSKEQCVDTGGIERGVDINRDIIILHNAFNELVQDNCSILKPVIILFVQDKHTFQLEQMMLGLLRYCMHRCAH